MRRISPLLLAAVLCILGAVSVTQAAIHGMASAKHHKAAKHPKVHGLKAPGLLTPNDGAHLQQIPALTWNAVSGAAEYEYEVAADARFHAIVLGKGPGMGASTTHNLAATLATAVTDGKYYWRVRGITATNKHGAWSTTRTLEKDWSTPPRLLEPAEGTAISWPTKPLVLTWTAVPGATEYIVTVATDPELSNIVVGSATSPQKTTATVFALPRSLPVGGPYYWAITPVDAAGHRGARSGRASFQWSWPTSTTTQLKDLTNPFGFGPQFSWAPIPGAAHYEVEVNQSPEFPAGSKWCCTDLVTGISLTPIEVLGNDQSFYWRVRAIDANGNAGVWNLGVGEHGAVGEGFTEAFDNVATTVPELAMRDAQTGKPEAAGTSTKTPIVTWAPAPGASSYEVQVTHYSSSEHGCAWVGAPIFATSTLAWTPLGSSHGNIKGWPPTITGSLAEGETYCVRVRARSDHDAKNKSVVSDWTQLGGLDEPAFTFQEQDEVKGTPGTNPSITYLTPAPVSTSSRTPLFTWERVAGAASYYVVIARDAAFTEVVDVASTIVPAYAPPLNSGEPLTDQVNAYYWAVVPFNDKGEEFALPPQRDHPQTFNKSSVPPTPLAPTRESGATVSGQPTFSWSPAESALNYTLQVSGDETFANPIDSVTTASTAYTSVATYPADTTLYWRVRANDANKRGLNWSAKQAFSHTLPVPTPAPSNLTGGEAIPVLTWTPVTGATGYDVHVEQPDGTTRDFTSASPAFTATEWAGPGNWRWQARAEFPKGVAGTIPGGYFSLRPFAHTIGLPTGASGVRSGSRIVISWHPQAYAKQYEVAISTSETFRPSIETHKVTQTSWAPNVDLTKQPNKGTLYWRVAAVDGKGNVGPYATGRFVPPKSKCVVRKVKRKHKTVKVCVAVKHKASKKKRSHR
jgi:hypothetical protein